MPLVLVSAILALIAWLTFGLLSVAVFMLPANKSMFTQIQKLIMVNNIARAIKLCNAENNPASNAAKALLMRANRPYSLELAYHEAINEHLKDHNVAWRKRATTFLLTLAIVGFVMATLGHFESVPGYTVYILAAFLAGIGMSNVVAAIFAGRLATAREGLLTVRNLLYTRKSFVPPAFTPVKEDTLTPQELADWRASMDAFEEDIVRRKDKGVTIDANDEYHRQANPDGVLPPL